MPAEAPFFFFLLSSSSHLHRSNLVRWWWWICARRQPPPFLLLPHLLFPILASPPASDPPSAASDGAEATETLPSHPHLPPRRPIETKLPLLPPNKGEANLRIPSLSSIREGKAAFNSELCCFLLRRAISCIRTMFASARLHVKRVNLAKLGTATLWRYWRHFNLASINPNPSKEQLVHGVQHHFLSQQLDEMQVIVGFIHTAKRLKTLYS